MSSRFISTRLHAFNSTRRWLRGAYVSFSSCVDMPHVILISSSLLALSILASVDARTCYSCRSAGDDCTGDLITCPADKPDCYTSNIEENGVKSVEKVSNVV